MMLHEEFRGDPAAQAPVDDLLRARGTENFGRLRRAAQGLDQIANGRNGLRHGRYEYTSGLQTASENLYSRVLCHQRPGNDILPRMADDELSFEAIGRRIRDLRESMGYHNAAEFAAYMGWSPQQLSNYERGRKRPEVSMAIQLCVRTHVTLDYIYRGDHTGLPLRVSNAIQDFQARQQPSPSGEASEA